MTKPLPPADVVALGVTTPLGFDIASTEAAVRADITRFRESDVFNKAFGRQVLSLVPEEQLPPLVAEVEGAPSAWIRTLRLSTLALADACAPAPAPVPLFLALPEERWSAAFPAQPLLFEQLAQQAEVNLDVGQGRLYRQGGAGGLIALGDALAAIAARRMPFAVVGGIDTFLSLRRLAELDAEDRLHGTSVDGFIPGEGAAFLLLAASDAARQHRLRPLARVAAAGTGTEPGHRYSPEPYRGEGLAAAFHALFATLPGGFPKVRCVYAGFNGEGLPAKEWGVAYLRNADRFEEEFSLEHPADCLGDAGAAMGPLSLALAAEGLQRRRRPGPCLVWSTSDREARGAAMVLPVNGA